MVVVDNTFLTLILHPNARPPRDPATNLPVDRLVERIELMIDMLSEDSETIIIPAPVLTEFLVLADKEGPKYISQIDQSPLFRVEPFDQRAAVELAALHLSIRASGGGRRGGQAATYAKITFDRQIVAIARVNSVNTIYSDDDGVKKFAERYEIQVVQSWELPLPPEKHPLLRYAEEASESIIVADSSPAVASTDDVVSDGAPESDTLPQTESSAADTEPLEDSEPRLSKQSKSDDND
jgi:predicted nucleic acid-binding protein